MSIQSLDIARECTGYHQVTDLSSAVSCPGSGSVVEIGAEGANVRYRLDGIDPTDTVGSLLPAGGCMVINIGQGNIHKIRLIETTADPGATINVHCFK